MESVAAIRPNISASGCRRRERIGRQLAAISISLLVAFVAFRAPWYWRLLIFLPAATAATSFLQSRRKTCVLRARQGTFEHDDNSTTKVPDDQARASREIARGIQRDATLIGLGSTALAVALAFI
jgi:hypothetical protein